MAVCFLCHSQFANAACNSEIKNAHTVSERIMNEWPIRPSQDEETLYVQKIVSYLVPTIKLHMGTRNFNWPNAGVWKFFLIRDLSVNAYSIGNGTVYLTDGIYDFVEKEAELAAIIAHEMAHQLLGHFCGKQISHTSHQVGSLSQVMNHTKEIEADNLAIEILLYTDFPAHALLAVVERLPVLMEGKKQKQLRIESLKQKLIGIDFMPSTSSPEFVHIQQSFKASLK